jgi:outer membrane protein insertion porin family/translocation and assembly module TamA
MSSLATPPTPAPAQAQALALGVALSLPLALGCASIPKGRAAIDSVDMEGVHDLSAGDIEDKIATTASPKFLGLWSGVMFDYQIFDPFVLQRDLARVERFYRARGYYEAHARAGRVEYVKPDHVRVVVVVDEGKPVVLDRIDIHGVEGLPVEARQAALAAAAVRARPRERFDEDDFEAASKAVKKALGDRGFAYATVRKSATVDLVRHMAVASFGIVPNHPARIGRIRIIGLGNLPEDPVRRAIDLDAGEPYSTQRLENAQQAVLDLGVFGAVDVQPDLSNPDAEAVPIDVRVEPSLLHTVRLGGGVELDVIKTDVHLRAGWEDRNFLGGMRNFSVDFRPGAVVYPTRLPDFQAPERLLPEERTRAQLSQPGFIEARTHGLLRADANLFSVLLTPQYNASDPVLGYGELRGAAGVDRTVWKLYSALTYNAQYDHPFAYVGSIDPSLRPLVLSYVDLISRLDFRDDKIHPHRGTYFGNELQFAGGPLGGDAEDIREQPEARAYVPITTRLTWASRGSVGFLFPLDYGDTLDTDTATGMAPPGVDKAQWERDVQIVYFRSFFAGGPSSNRGWPFMGIGPHGIAPFFNPALAAQAVALECTPGNSNYDPVRCAVPLGGLSLWEASTELRYSLSKQLEGSTFCDAADVSQRRWDIRFQRPHLSCGIGIAYDTPVGPIRLNVAYRIPGAQSFEPVQPGDDGNPGAIFGVPIAIAFGIGEAY